MHFSEDLWNLIKNNMKLDNYYIEYSKEKKDINNELMSNKREECDEKISYLLNKQTSSEFKKYKNIFKIYSLVYENINVYHYFSKECIKTEKFLKTVEGKCIEMFGIIPALINELELKQNPWYKRKKDLLLKVKLMIKRLLNII
jgi:hypothetical protein